MSLQILYRPPTFKMFAGNEELKSNLKEILKRKNPPSSFLIVGPSGCGKTTLGRIIKKYLRCHDDDYKEMNAANDRTLPAIRAVLEDMKYTPMSGDKKVILMDECFAPDTKISTTSNQIPISEIKVGDRIYNLNGIDIVEKVFKNKIPLNHVVRVNKADGTCTFCSKNHEYYLNNKWVKAKYLTGLNLLCYSKHNVNNMKLKRDYQDEKLSKLWNRILSKRKNQAVLFPNMCGAIQSQNKQCEKTTANRSKTLQMVWERLHPKNKKKRTILFSILCESLDAFTRTYKEENIHSRKKYKYEKKQAKIFKNRKSKSFKPTILGKNEKEQSFIQSKKFRESSFYKEIKRFIACLDRETWGQRTINRAPEIAYDCVGVGSRSAYQNLRSLTDWFPQGMERSQKSSNLLQSRYRKPGIENCNRGGFKKSSNQETQKFGQEERIITTMERVESVEIYQRGSNDESFQSIIGDKERNQGYIEFYDLQIKDNHSYIANGNMVHNCHQLLGNVQEALLKALEEPPAHVHFILCTTNPEALKDTFKRRCHIYEVSSLNSNELTSHLKKIIKKEKVKNFPVEVLEKVVELSNGSLGIALKYLDMVIDMKDADEAIRLLKTSGTSEKDVMELCRALVDFKINDKTRWHKVKKILQNFTGDAESARRPILGYLNTCLLNSKEGANFAIVIDEFKDSFMYSGKAGLSLACFKSCFISDEEE